MNIKHCHKSHSLQEAIALEIPTNTTSVYTKQQKLISDMLKFKLTTQNTGSIS